MVKIGIDGYILWQQIPFTFKGADSGFGMRF